MANQGRQTGSDAAQPDALRPDEVEKLANDAVTVLRIGGAIQREIDREGPDSLFARIEESDAFAVDAPVNADMMFVALSLPIANGLIYLGTSRVWLKEARTWISGQPHGDDDPDSTLAALTLIYIVKLGWRKFRTDPEPQKRATWERIHKRVEKLKKQDTDTTAAQKAAPA